MLVERLKNLGPDDNAELLSGQFEGDIVMSPEEFEILTGGSRGGRTGLIDTRRYWTDKTVPYLIRESDFSEFINVNLFDINLLYSWQNLYSQRTNSLYSSWCRET